MPSAARRVVRAAGILLAAVALLLLAAFFALRQALPPERLATLLAQHVSEATGRTLRIEGALSFRLWPTVAIEAGKVSLANADWASSPQMFRADTIAFEISLRDLLHREFRILSVDLNGLDLDLESDGDGRFNWQFAREKKEGSGTGSSSLLSLDHFGVADARVRYRSGESGAMRQLNIESLALDAQGDGNQLSAALKLGAQLWKIEGRTGPVGALLGGDHEWPIDLKAGAEGASLAAQGTLGLGAHADTFQGKASSRLTSTAVLARFGSAAAKLPMPVDASATLSLAPTRLRAESMVLSIAGQQFTGRVNLLAEPAPLHVEAELAAASIDLARLHPALGGATAPSTSAGAALFGNKPLPIDDLPEFEADVALRIGRLSVPDVPELTSLVVRVVTRPHLLTLAPLDFKFAGGPVRASLKLALRAGTAPQVDAQVNASALSVEVLDGMRSSRGKHFNGGRANFEAALKMNGSTPASLAASATGSVLLTVSGVALAGKAASFDEDILARLFDALIPKSTPRENLPLQCVVARLPLRNGVAKIDRSLAMETQQIAVAAVGEVNLSKQTIALAFQPRVKKGLDLNAASLVELLLLTGPLQAPQLSINPIGAARQAADLGIAAATGGLSLLAPVLRGSGDESTCGFAAGKSAGGGQAGADARRGERQPRRPLRNLLGR